MGISMMTERKIPRRRGISPEDIARGQRLKEIHDTLNVTGEQFARMASKGSPRSYTGPTISKIENGRQAMSFEQALDFFRLDPKRRGLVWFIYGARALGSGGHVPGIPVAPTAPVPNGDAGGGKGASRARRRASS